MAFSRTARRTAQKQEDSETLAEISALAAEIESAGHRTLGEHLAALRAVEPLVRIRGKHTRRDMFKTEFNELWESQRRHCPKVMTDSLREELEKLVFFQRKMYWPKSTVGKCSLEPKERRCPRADRVAQRFRLLQEINNLRIIPPSEEPRVLTGDERAKLLDFLSRSKERTFNELRDHLGLLESYGFNLEGGERRKLLGMPTDAILAGPKLFGKKWHARPEEEKNAIVRASSTRRTTPPFAISQLRSGACPRRRPNGLPTCTYPTATRTSAARPSKNCFRIWNGAFH